MANTSSTTTIDELETDSGEPTHPLAETGQAAAEKASRLAERAGDIGFQQADRGLNLAASGAEKVAETIQRISTEMQTDQPQIANVAQTAAEQADALSRYLRETDAREIVRTVENAARRQPILFLGGAFVLGLAASRFLKAATTDQGQKQGRLQAYGSSYQPTSGYSASSGIASTGTRRTGSFEATGPGTGNGSADLDEGI